MAKHASGTFEVQIKPQPPDERTDGASLGRMYLDKQFHGALEAIGKGQMLTAMSAVKGSAGYVAIERVTGKLDGHEGSFVLQHSGIATAASQNLTVQVVPDSGTAELVGLSGTLGIKIVEGKHFYDFQYDLP